MVEQPPKKAYLTGPKRLSRSPGQKVLLGLSGILLSPIYWLLAHKYRVPGLNLQIVSAWLGVRILLRRRVHVPLSILYPLVLAPMDTVRYFEFDFMWRLVSDSPIQRYLDVSSPRLLPIWLAESHPGLMADLVNPDRRDLDVTSILVRGLGLEPRCALHNCPIESSPFASGTFDLITCISVLEHIPDDTNAIERMWSLLKPAGRLLLSVPCAAKPLEEYLDCNEYGLLDPAEDGYWFRQRFYTWDLLRERIFAVTGPPRRSAIYGERSAGALLRLTARKWTDPSYPYWREPYVVGREFQYFGNLSDLPGQGVVAMEFVKE